VDGGVAPATAEALVGAGPRALLARGIGSGTAVAA
jgi:hypothetical protein